MKVQFQSNPYYNSALKSRLNNSKESMANGLSNPFSFLSKHSLSSNADSVHFGRKKALIDLEKKPSSIKPEEPYLNDLENMLPRKYWTRVFGRPGENAKAVFLSGKDYIPTDEGEDDYLKWLDEEHEDDIWKKIIEKNVIVDPEEGISFPIYEEQDPHFTPRTPPQEGVGQGEGEPGDEIGQEKGDGKPGPGQPGNKPGENGRETWTAPKSMQEFMKWLKKKLKLPNIKRRHGEGVPEIKIKYDSEKDHRPGDVIVDKTFKRAIKTQLAEITGKQIAIMRNMDRLKKEREELVNLNGIDPEAATKHQQRLGKIDLEIKEYEQALVTLQKNRKYIFIRDKDIRRIDYRMQEIPTARTVIFLIRDASGSMMDTQKERSRIHMFLLEMVLRDIHARAKAELENRNPDDFTNDDFWNDPNFQVVYINHTTEAKKVPRSEAYYTTESGGTYISSAYILMRKYIEQFFDPTKWNIYGVHFSDGDNWSNDNPVAMGALEQLVKMGINRFAFVDVERPSYSSGTSFTDLVEKRYATDNKDVVKVTRVRGDVKDYQPYADSITKILEEDTEAAD